MTRLVMFAVGVCLACDSLYIEIEDAPFQDWPSISLQLQQSMCMRSVMGWSMSTAEASLTSGSQAGAVS